VVYIGLIDLRILKLHCVRQKATEAAAPLDDAGNRNPEHQVIGLNVVLIGLAQLLHIF
jgi:hypothetical protein